jgi:hypothetical protein
LARGSASVSGGPSPTPHRKGGGGAVRRPQRRNGGREEDGCRSEHRRAGARLRGQRWPRRPPVLHRWSLGRGGTGSTAPRFRDQRQQRRRKHCGGVEERGGPDGRRRDQGRRAVATRVGERRSGDRSTALAAARCRCIGEMGAGKGWRWDKWMTGGGVRWNKNWR